MTSSSGQTFQITGTSVGGKVVTTKLSVPANSKIVTVNVPTSQGGMAALSFIASMFVFYYFLWASLGEIFRCVKTHWLNWSAGCWPSHTCGALKGGVCLQSFWMLMAANAGLSILLFTGHYPLIIAMGDPGIQTVSAQADILACTAGSVGLYQRSCVFWNIFVPPFIQFFQMNPCLH